MNEYREAMRRSHQLIQETQEEVSKLREEIECARETVARSLILLSRVQEKAERGPMHRPKPATRG